VTVAELIDLLKEWPANALVVVHGEHYGYDDIEMTQERVLSRGTGGGYGPCYDQFMDSVNDPETKVMAIVIE
jgi:hypothetical protein